MLLWWKGVPVSKMGNVVNRCILHEKYAEGGAEEVSIPTPWTENDQIELNALRNASIKMANTSLDASWCNIRGTSAGIPEDVRQGESGLQAEDGGDV
jgi:hypothetical protein